MAKAKGFVFPYGGEYEERFVLEKETRRDQDFISVQDEVMRTRVLVALENVDAFCEALKAFRDEVTKPKMTGGEKVWRAEVGAWDRILDRVGDGLSWSDLCPRTQDAFNLQAELLGIKDDE